LIANGYALTGAGNPYSVGVVAATAPGGCSKKQPCEIVPLHGSNMSAENDYGSRFSASRKALCGA
jgi:hypothetical protein